MGEPIKQLGFRADDPDVRMTDDRVQLYMNVKGPQDKGIFICIHLGPKAVYLITSSRSIWQGKFFCGQGK